MLCTYNHGGAGTAAMRLYRALCGLSGNGRLTSRFYCASSKYAAEGVCLLPGLARCQYELMAALAGYPGRPPGSEHFSIPQLCCDPATIALPENFDVINLHWLGGMFDPALAPEALAGRPVVWTLHDMNPFTGGCHYSAGCARYAEHCGQCPELGSDDPRDLSFQTWRLRMGVYRTLNLHIVCPSAWLAEEAKKSFMFRRFPVRVIHNAHPLDIFRPLRRDATRRALGFKAGETVLLFVSESLRNKRKGGEYLLRALSLLASRPGADRIRLVLLGSAPPADFFQTGLRAESAGHVDDQESMALLYNAADAVITPSLEDNQPNVVCEALGCGTPVVAFAVGGVPEMLRHMETGWLAPLRDAEGLAAGMEWAASVKNHVSIRRRCRAFALENYSASAQAEEYMKLFHEISGCQHVEP
jgi:glycosyltransferase involved in cell wall biosynthesis